MTLILAINPGSTSTKIALYSSETELWSESILYNSSQLAVFKHVLEQLDVRERDIRKLLKKKNVKIETLSAVVSRGGPFKPLESGTYKINEALLNDIKNGKVQAEHVSNIGALLAHNLVHEIDLPAYFVDPVSVDEFESIARVSGLPELERRSLFHALNVKATAHLAAKEMEKPLNKLNLIVAHLGGGISICSIKGGRVIDVNNANESGPFSPERSGSLPVSSLVKLCYSGKYTYDDMRRKIVGKGGLSAHLGTNDLGQVIEQIEKGDQHTHMIFEAMAYQIAKEIGAMATVLHGNVDAILLTGGMAHRDMLVDWIKSRISFIAPVRVYPGENEMKALVQGVLRVLEGKEKAKKY